MEKLFFCIICLLTITISSVNAQSFIGVSGQMAGAVENGIVTESYALSANVEAVGFLNSRWGLGGKVGVGGYSFDPETLIIADFWSPNFVGTQFYHITPGVYLTIPGKQDKLTHFDGSANFGMIAASEYDFNNVLDANEEVASGMGMAFSISAVQNLQFSSRFSMFGGGEIFYGRWNMESTDRAIVTTPETENISLVMLSLKIGVRVNLDEYYSTPE